MYKVLPVKWCNELYRLEAYSNFGNCDSARTSETSAEKFLSLMSRMHSIVNSVPLSKQFVSIKNCSSMHRNNSESLRRLYGLSQMHSVFLRVPWAITLSGRETLPEFLSHSLLLAYESAFQLRTKYPRCTPTISKCPQRRKNSIRL